MKPKKKSKNKSFWIDGLSIDEARFSALVAMTLLGFVYALFSHFFTGDITENLLNLIQTLILSIVGVNVSGHVTAAIHNKREDKK
ncbi:hypothetical protein ACQKEX_14845 [Bacillus pumilus]|uniref:hypothetical protein n=1 Tax=Bacillus TaxID=1386 RepID=UPI001C2230C1|nr:hypothetical protein [Bacillus pumilus]MBU8576390.1 hypothetical protein [Bacillus pumilus]